MCISYQETLAWAYFPHRYLVKSPVHYFWIMHPLITICYTSVSVVSLSKQLYCMHALLGHWLHHLKECKLTIIFHWHSLLNLMYRLRIVLFILILIIYEISDQSCNFSSLHVHMQARRLYTNISVVNCRLCFAHSVNPWWCHSLRYFRSYGINCLKDFSLVKLVAHTGRSRYILLPMQTSILWFTLL